MGGWGLVSWVVMITKQDLTEHRGRQLAVGGLIILIVSVSVISLHLFWRNIPGWIGESVGVFAGVISTPFFMEFSFTMLGLGIVIALNSWRRRSGGGEFIEVDEKDLPAEFRSGPEEMR